jgi:hypothetical protein
MTLLPAAVERLDDTRQRHTLKPVARYAAMQHGARS